MSLPHAIAFLPKVVDGGLPSPAPSSEAPRAIRYDVISQRHPAADPKRFEQIEDLYAGGFQIQHKAEKYIDPHLFELPKRFKNRCKTTAYLPFFGQIVDQFVSDLFTQPLTVTPAGDAKNPNTPGEFPDVDFYADLAKDIDGRGADLESVAADLLTTALKHRCAYLMVDAPAVDGEAANRQEEESAGARRCYAYEVSPDMVIDWRDDDRGALEWVLIRERRQDRASIGGKRDTVVETFTLWDTVGEGDEARAAWHRYSIEYQASKPPQAETMVALEDEGVSSFRRVPLLRLELPFGLWVGNKIAPMAIEHWRRRSELVGAEAISCVAIPYVTQGPEMPAMGEMNSEVQQDPNRGNNPVAKFESKGFLVLGHQDTLDFAEPKGHAYELIDKQIDGVREAMYSVNHQMAASVRPTSTALGRSGLSKQKDHDSTAKVLGALGRIVRRFVVMLYDTISRGRNEDVVWVAHGLDNFDAEDREQILEESLQLLAVSIPSPTFRKEHAKRVAAKLVPNLPPDTVAQIADEIDSGVDEHQEMQDLEAEARKDAIQNPPEAEAKTDEKPEDGGRANEDE